MKNKFYFIHLVVFTLVGFLSIPTAMAITPYARQTGLPCSSCHFQHFPELNSFGRDFKTKGYTMVGGDQKLLEVAGLSIPSVVTPGMQIIIDAKKRTGTVAGGTSTKAGMDHHGALYFPTDVSIFLGGRIAPFAGYFFELSLMDGDSDNRFSAFRMPMGFDFANVHFQAVPFTTDSDGVAFGYETLNSGLLRQSLINSNTTAFGYLGVTHSDANYDINDGNGTMSTEQLSNATGLAFVASQPMWYANYTIWKNSHGTGDHLPIKLTTPLHYFRAALTPTIAGWDLAAGAVAMFGTEKHFDTNLADGTSFVPHRDSVSVFGGDLQAQGSINEFPVGFYASYAAAPTSDGNPNIYNSTGNSVKQAVAFNGEFGIFPNKLIVGAGYRFGKNGMTSDQDSAGTLEVNYYPVLNMQFGLNEQYIWSATNYAVTTFRLRAAF